MKNKFNTIFFIILWFFNTALAESEKSLLTVKVSGAIPNKGQVIFSIFTSPEDYLKRPLISNIKPVNKDGEVIFILENLKYGKYAISVIYDEDNDGKLNTNFLGIPTEHVGSSNNVKGSFGPPSFSDTAFIFNKSNELHITLNKVTD